MRKSLSPFHSNLSLAGLRAKLELQTSVMISLENSGYTNLPVEGEEDAMHIERSESPRKSMYNALRGCYLPSSHRRRVKGGYRVFLTDPEGPGSDARVSQGYRPFVLP